MGLPRRVLLVTGLRREASIIGDGAQVIVGGGSSDRLAQDLDQAAAAGAGAFLSMGIAGGLQPGIGAGIVIVASAVVANGTRITTTPAWTERLNHAIPGSILGEIAGADRITATIGEKAALRQATGAVAVDMESHVVALAAQRHGIPVAAIRIIADPAERPLPPAAQAGFASDGGIDVGGVVRALAAAPGQLPALVRTALDARQAFRALARCRRLVGAGLCFPDLG